MIIPQRLKRAPSKVSTESAALKKGSVGYIVLHFKAGLLDGGSFPGLAEAKLEVSHYVAYYNAERRHSALSYHYHNHFETQLKNTSQLYPAKLDNLRNTHPAS